MKKRLSILLTAVMVLTMVTGCGGNSGKKAELDAPYQFRSISGFDMWSDNFKDGLPTNEAIEESDERIVNACTYESLIACFEPIKVDASNVCDYFVGIGGGENLSLWMAENCYVAEDVEITLEDVNGETATRVYKQWNNDSFGSCSEEENELLTMDTIDRMLSSMQFPENFCVYKFNPSAVNWVSNDMGERLYVMSKAQNSYGEYTLIEEFANYPTDIGILLRRMNENGLINEDGSFKVIENITPDSGTTPDSGSSEQTPTPKPEKPAVQFVGVYWYLTEDLEGEGGGRDGFYLDGNGNYIQVSKSEQNSFYKEERWTYSNLSSKTVADGVEFTFDIYNKKYNVSSSCTYVVGSDGRIKDEINESDWGGIYYYAPVDKATFYSKPAGYVETPYYEHAFMGCYFIEMTSDWQYKNYGLYLDSNYAYLNYPGSSKEPIPYTFVEKGTGFYMITLATGEEFYYRGQIVDVMKNGEKVAQLGQCTKAEYDAVGSY